MFPHPRNEALRAQADSPHSHPFPRGPAVPSSRLPSPAPPHLPCPGGGGRWPLCCQEERRGLHRHRQGGDDRAAAGAGGGERVGPLQGDPRGGAGGSAGGQRAGRARGRRSWGPGWGTDTAGVLRPGRRRRGAGCQRGVRRARCRRAPSLCPRAGGRAGPARPRRGAPHARGRTMRLHVCAATLKGKRAGSAPFLPPPTCTCSPHPLPAGPGYGDPLGEAHGSARYLGRIGSLFSSFT